jgi:hypothetical protein
MNMTLVYSIILDMTLLYLIMFSIILFLVYFDYMFGIVRSDLYSSIGSYSTCSLISWVSSIGSYSTCSLISWVSGKHRVGVVLISYLPTIVPYIPDRVVDRRSDSLVEFSIVHLLSIGQAEHNYYR